MIQLTAQGLFDSVGSYFRDRIKNHGGQLNKGWGKRSDPTARCALGSLDTEVYNCISDRCPDGNVNCSFTEVGYTNLIFLAKFDISQPNVEFLCKEILHFNDKYYMKLTIEDLIEWENDITLKYGVKLSYILNEVNTPTESIPAALPITLTTFETSEEPLCDQLIPS